jgi:hypothetical protein
MVKLKYSTRNCIAQLEGVAKSIVFIYTLGRNRKLATVSILILVGWTDGVYQYQSLKNPFTELYNICDAQSVLLHSLASYVWGLSFNGWSSESGKLCTVATVEQLPLTYSQLRLWEEGNLYKILNQTSSYEMFWKAKIASWIKPMSNDSALTKDTIFFRECQHP